MSELPVGTVVVDGVSKRYRLGMTGTLRGTLSALMRHRRDGDDSRDLWALKDVSFRVEPGESLGIIGPNGAGKTTALRLLSNITRPTRGTIRIAGRTSSLIALGAGFHPELTGRENIFLNGAILGLSHREIQRKLDEIIVFSELERFIDTPVKRYSSGMYVRLGFAVAAHVEPDVLLVDEVLAVGDASYRQKCMARMRSLRKDGVTLLYVSHNMHQVRTLCDRTLLLVSGRSVFLGSSSRAISAYAESTQSTQQSERDSAESSDGDETDVVITDVALSDAQGSASAGYRYNQRLQLRVRYHTYTAVPQPLIKVRLIRSDGVVCALAGSHYAANAQWRFDGEGVFSVLFDPIQLATGTYMIEVRIVDNTDTVLLASGQSRSFWVKGPAFIHEPDQGVYVPKASWTHNGEAS